MAWAWINYFMTSNSNKYWKLRFRFYLLKKKTQKFSLILFNKHRWVFVGGNSSTFNLHKSVWYTTRVKAVNALNPEYIPCTTSDSSSIHIYSSAWFRPKEISDNIFVPFISIENQIWHPFSVFEETQNKYDVLISFFQHG